MPMHSLLARQLKKLHLIETEPPDSSIEWKSFLDRIDQSYNQFDEDRNLLERSLTLSSQEMQERWLKLQENQKTIEKHQVDLINSSRLAILGEMAGGIAHEINSPLATMKLLVSLIKKEQSLELSDQPATLNEQKLLQRIETLNKTIDRVASIIRNLKAFAREGDCDPFLPENLNQIITDTLLLCNEKIKLNNISLIISNPFPELIITCRAIQIEQILLNIINNSFDAIKNFEIKWIKIDIEKTNETVKIIISDCGPGISKDIADKIFNPFFTTKEHSEGTGLGLSVSLGIVKSHKGKLYINPHSQNTSFIIELPLT
jgi:C4-dicarboxylate-specific signal transduction histidine kinase